jgi:hypothetical protein
MHLNAPACGVFGDIDWNFQLGKLPEPLRRHVDLTFGEGARATLFSDDQCCQGIARGGDGIGQLQNGLLAFAMRAPAPAIEGVLRCGDGFVEIGGRCARRIGKYLASGWIDDRNGSIHWGRAAVDGHGVIGAHGVLLHVGMYERGGNVLIGDVLNVPIERVPRIRNALINMH